MVELWLSLFFGNCNEMSPSISYERQQNTGALNMVRYLILLTLAWGSPASATGLENLNKQGVAIKGFEQEAASSKLLDNPSLYEGSTTAVAS